MDLILWRHADAGKPLDDDVLDLQRALSPKGVKHAARMAQWLQRVLPDRVRVLASPAQRCRQTAQALGRKFQTRDALGPHGDVQALLTLAGWPERRTPALIVGHQPTLGATVAWLMSGAPGAAPPAAPSWTMRKGAVWWLRHRVRDGAVEVVLVAVRGPDEL